MHRRNHRSVITYLPIMIQKLIYPFFYRGEWGTSGEYEMSFRVLNELGEDTMTCRADNEL